MIGYAKGDVISESSAKAARYGIRLHSVADYAATFQRKGFKARAAERAPQDHPGSCEARSAMSAATCCISAWMHLFDASNSGPPNR